MCGHNSKEGPRQGPTHAGTVTLGTPHRGLWESNVCNLSPAVDDILLERLGRLRHSRGESPRQ